MDGGGSVVAPAPRLLRAKAAAAYCGFSESTFAKYRLWGTGPVFRRVGGRRIVYDIADLDAWLDGQKKRASTAEA